MQGNRTSPGILPSQALLHLCRPVPPRSLAIVVTSHAISSPPLFAAAQAKDLIYLPADLLCFCPPLVTGRPRRNQPDVRLINLPLCPDVIVDGNSRADRSCPDDSVGACVGGAEVVYGLVAADLN